MERAHPNHELISSEQVEGTSVFDRQGEKVGKIDHLMIDKRTGHVIYAVMSFGGFLGQGHNHYPLPWSALSYDKDLEGYSTAVSEQQLRDAPEFTDDAWQDRNWETRIHDHYGVPYYW
jgi:sporulation protein YlmC with PRC-barrel domain